MFQAQLHREKRRADRSKAPLSMAWYRLDGADSERDADRLLKLLSAVVRETDMIGRLRATEVAVLCPETGENGMRRFIEKVGEKAGNLVFSVESATYPHCLFDRDSPRASPGHGAADWMLDDSLGTRSSGTYALKRTMDIVGASVALVLLAPLMLLTALAVKLTSPGPVIFAQTRLGKGAMPFSFYKFRSMVVNGDDRIHRDFVKRLIRGEHENVNQQDGTNPLYKLKADPRITWLGRIIRRTSVDELPQLFNVLRGELSLVGPRPPLPYEAENYHSWHLRRVLEVKPGITGLWQVAGRSRVSFDEMVRLDLHYARHCSLMFDLSILVRTVNVVLRCKGAK
jgi:lipopolysaccharide/colanic/teichoic acid biosynthesis glycosyltransferase